ncbi:MAG: NTP transferase domain-containing protein [Clostridia bacterium]|nr:NTP transferase domain-containing protein [Clostridia bacterium]
MIDKYLISSDFTVKKTIEYMEENLIKAVIIVDDEKKVLGLFSNGDMRSYFLKGGELNASVTSAMNVNPVLYKSRDDVEDDRKKRIKVIYPVVDDDNHIIDVIDYNNPDSSGIINDSLRDVPLVIMAGGKGTRLYPYTKILPKPLIPIGDLTITERIIDSFRKFGVNDVKMIVNYKGGMIKSYMSELDKDYNLCFIDEDKFLGTAGGLKLLKDKVDSAFFVSNCDILIDADFECVYRTHKNNGNLITFVCSMKNFEIPYGVIETNEDGSIVNMKEKPSFSYLINTGLYLIEPEVLDFIEDNEFIHLPDLAKRCSDKGYKIGVFPISEKSWMDMGQFSEMENMKNNLGI